MSTFNGAAIAGYLRSIFLTKQNISNALVAKGVNLDGVGFGGLANAVDPSIPVRPMPVVPEPAPVVPSKSGGTVNVNKWFGANPTQLRGGTQLYGSRITAIYQVIVPPEPNDRVVILDTYIPFSTDNFACSVGLNHAEGAGAYTIPAYASEFSFTSTIFSANLEYVFLAKLRLGQEYTSPQEDFVESPFDEPAPDYGPLHEMQVYDASYEGYADTTEIFTSSDLYDKGDGYRYVNVKLRYMTPG